MADPATSKVQALVCPACGAPVNLRAAGYTVSLNCEHCGSTLDALDPQLKLIRKADGAARKPRIPLGTRGVLKGVLWETVGYLERWAGSSWSEYLLFNPYYGYRFLIDDRRCWSFGELMDGPPATAGKSGPIVDGGVPMTLFEPPYSAEVSVALGEFYWRVAEGETVRVWDYVRPGVMICNEKAEDEETWTRLEIVDARVVEKAFGMSQRFNRSSRPSPHEPSMIEGLLKPFWMIAAAASLVAIALCIVAPPEESLKSGQYDVVREATEQTVTLGELDLPRDYNRVVVLAQGAGMDNDWIDVDLSLVNQQTQASFDAYTLTEAYHGVDSDGPWSEGQNNRRVVLSHVPKGRYDLVMDVGAHHWTAYTPLRWDQPTSDAHQDDQSWGANPTLSVWVSRGGVSMWNLILALLAIITAPALMTYYQYHFDLRRRGLQE